MRKFKDLLIWNERIKLVMDIYKICSALPDTEKYGLKSQMQRAAVSISSNIAEGCSRKSDLEFARFLEISLGSAYELETQLIIVTMLNMIRNKEINNELMEKIHGIQKMISSFRSKLPISQKPNNLRT